MLAHKAGLVHVHVGESDRRLAPLRTVLDDYDVEADWFYPTHVERSEMLMGEAVHLAQTGGRPSTWTWWSATSTSGCGTGATMAVRRTCSPSRPTPA